MSRDKKLAIILLAPLVAMNVVVWGGLAYRWVTN